MAIGYDAEWHCIPATYVGAPHLRDRCWIIAYPNADCAGRREQGRSRAVSQELTAVECVGLLWPTPNAVVSQLGETPASWLARRERLKAKCYNSRLTQNRKLRLSRDERHVVHAIRHAVIRVEVQPTRYQ